MAYRWANPYEWLKDKAGEHLLHADYDRLYKELLALAARMDSDTLQELYEREMDKDGYFDKNAGLYNIFFVPDDPNDVPVNEDGCMFDPENPDVRSYAQSFSFDFPEGADGIIKVYDGAHMVYSERVTIGSQEGADG